MADDNAATLLLTYIKLLAKRHGGYRASSDFESRLFEAVGADGPSQLLTPEDRDHLRYLVGRTNLWVIYDLKTNEFRLIDVYEWIDRIGKE